MKTRATELNPGVMLKRLNQLPRFKNHPVAIGSVAWGKEKHSKMAPWLHGGRFTSSPLALWPVEEGRDQQVCISSSL